MSQDFSGAAGSPQQQPPRKRSPWLIVLIILLVVGGGGIAICCGGGYFAMQKGLDVFAESVKEDLRNDPVIRQQLGEVQSVEMDFSASAQASQGDQQVMVFDVEGTKGSGRVRGEVMKSDPNQVRLENARLELPDGSTHELELE